MKNIDKIRTFFTNINAFPCVICELGQGGGRMAQSQTTKQKRLIISGLRLLLAESYSIFSSKADKKCPVFLRVFNSERAKVQLLSDNYSIVIGQMLNFCTLTIELSPNSGGIFMTKKQNKGMFIPERCTNFSRMKISTLRNFQTATLKC